VVVHDVEAIRGGLEHLIEIRGRTGPDVDELWRESMARCAERWRQLGLSRDEAFKLANDLRVGAPSPRARSALRRPLTIVTGEVGIGKSLLLDRLFQMAIVRSREVPEAPFPAFVEAREVEGSLKNTVVQKTSSLGNPRDQGAAVFLDVGEEAAGPRPFAC
jgi:predicted ATPase